MFCKVRPWKSYFCNWSKKNWPTLTSSTTELPQNIESPLFVPTTRISKNFSPINMYHLKSWSPPFYKGRGRKLWSSEMYFLFRGPAWKCFAVYIISQKCTENIFVWWQKLENIIPWGLLVTTIYSCCTRSCTWEKIFFVSWLGLKTFCSFCYQANQFDGQT